MKKLMKNKKGQIPVISDIKDIIIGFWGNTPKPVKFLIMLVLLFLVGSIINWSLQIFGLFCDSNDNPVNIGLNVGNIGLIFGKPSAQELSGEGLEVNTRFNVVTPEITCSVFLPKGSNITYIANDSEKVLSAGQYFFMANVNCNVPCVKVHACPVGSICKTGCEGNVYRKNDSDMNIIIRNWNCKYEFFESPCAVPEGMYYNSLTNNYVCSTQDCFDKNLDDATKVWDNRLQELGAKYVYPEGINTKYGYERFVGLTCKDLSIHLAVFGVDIFDYKLWIMLTLVIIMVYFYKNWQDK